MWKYFTEVKTIHELRKQYKDLLKKHHPDNGGSEDVMKEINAEYDSLSKILSRETESGSEDQAYDYEAGDEAFKAVLNEIIHINADIEIIGNWIWVHGGYEYREVLKNAGFRYAPKKKCWCWHYGEYKRHHKGDISLDDIRIKYGSQTVSSKSKRYALN